MMTETNKTQTTADKAPKLRTEKLNVGKLNLRDELISLNRTSKVVKGGRNFSFSALVCVGDGEGHVGLGFGKANEVPEAIGKAAESAKRNVVEVPMMGRTLPHAVNAVFARAKIAMKPASKGTGLIAGAQVRKVLELAGYHDVLAKSLGSDNVMNVAKAALEGLKSLRRPEDVARLRGKSVEELIGVKRTRMYEDSMTKVIVAAGEKPNKPEPEEPAPEETTEEATSKDEAPEAVAEKVPEAVSATPPAEAVALPSEPTPEPTPDTPQA